MIPLGQRLFGVVNHESHHRSSAEFRPGSLGFEPLTTEQATANPQSGEGACQTCIAGFHLAENARHSGRSATILFLDTTGSANPSRPPQRRRSAEVPRETPASYPEEVAQITYPPSTSRMARWASLNEASVMALFAASQLAMAMRPKGWRARSHGRSCTGQSLVHATSSVVGS